MTELDKKTLSGSSVEEKDGNGPVDGNHGKSQEEVSSQSRGIDSDTLASILKTAVTTAITEATKAVIMQAGSQHVIQPMVTSGVGPRLPFLEGDGHATYPQWKRTVESILRSDGTWDFVGESTKCVEYSRSVVGAVNTDKTDAFDENGSVGVSEVRNHQPQRNDTNSIIAGKLFSSLMMSLTRCEQAQVIVRDVPIPNVRELWIRLEQHFEGLSELSQSHLMTEFMKMKMNNHEKVNQWIARVKKVVFDLERVNVKIDSPLMIHRIIEGLDERYDLARSLWYAQNGITTMSFDQVCVYLRTQEVTLGASGVKSRHSSKPNVNTVNVRPLNASSSHSKRGVTCFRCKGDHFIKDCPQGNVNKTYGGHNDKRHDRRDHKGKNMSLQCDYCAAKGHTVSQCFIKARADTLKKNQSSSASNSVSSSDVSASSSSPKPIASLGVSSSSSSGIVTVRGANNVSTINTFSAQQRSSSNEWLIDSGAAENLGPSDTPIANATKSDVQLQVASGEILKSPRAGELYIDAPSANKVLHFSRVLTHERMNARLLSASRICESPLVQGIWFDRDGAQVIANDGEVMLRAVQENGCYVVKNCSYVTGVNHGQVASVSHSM